MRDRRLPVPGRKGNVLVRCRYTPVACSRLLFVSLLRGLFCFGTNIDAIVPTVGWPGGFSHSADALRLLFPPAACLRSQSGPGRPARPIHLSRRRLSTPAAAD